MGRRIASLWFPRLASDRHLRARPCASPFALTLSESNTERLHCLNAQAELEGLGRGMGLAQARAIYPDLVTAPGDPREDQRFLTRLARWAGRYCPWVGLDGTDGLVMDITGSAHLFGGEAALESTIRQRLGRAGMGVRIGIAPSRGAAWAFARFDEGVVSEAGLWDRLAPLPIAALRLDHEATIGLERLGIGTIGAFAELPRASLTRRFGPAPLMRLDQACARQPEPVTPVTAPKCFSARLTLPEPIGLVSDLTAALSRLLDRLCQDLAGQHKGARVLLLTLRRVDQAASQIELRLARPMRDPARLSALFSHHTGDIDAGFGIDQLRLEATATEALPPVQPSRHSAQTDDDLADLITRLGNRVGLDHILRFLPADSHIPERSFTAQPAATTEPATWPRTPPRPLRMFPPEPILANGPAPPTRFRWRAMHLVTARATGPERIAPEWWRDDPNWHSGLRDYWRIETRQGRRLWMFHTPQTPAWFVHGEFA